MATTKAPSTTMDELDLDGDTSVQIPPPAPPKAPPPPPQKSYAEKPASKKPLARPEQFIFRKLKKVHPAIDKINVDFHWLAHAYLATSSTILWPYKVVEDGSRKPLPLNDNIDDLNEPDVQWYPRTVRYLYSANSPFVDEQEKQFGNTLLRNDGGFNEVLDNPQNRDGLVLTGPELKVEAYDTVRVEFLRISGQCSNMHPKARRRNQKPIYQMLDFGQIDKSKVEKGRLKKAMYEIAGNAKLEEMIPHAKHLGIPFIVPETKQERDLDAIREDYKEMALDNPEYFEQTFRDPKIKIMHQIITLKDNGQLIISAGRAKWAHTGTVITLIPATANPIEFLANFSLENRDFAEQLAAFKVGL
jgi:hypothetical protein